MKLENQVVSLELAKKLKELGVKQESLFYWVRRDMQADDSVVQIMQNKIHESYGETLCSAFTVAELGEMLPKEKMTFVNWFESGWRIDYGTERDEHSRVGAHLIDKNLANAIAKMVIYLLENKII